MILCHELMQGYSLFTAQSGLLMTLNEKAFENIVGEGENAGITSIFSFSHNVFYPSQKKFFYSNL